MNVIKKLQHRGQRGFTLLEVLLVVAIIAILAGIVIIAINPGKNLADTRNAQRSSDVTTILNGVYQYILDNNGVAPTSIGATAVEVCATTGAPCTTPATIDLGVLTASGKYLVAIPKDPQCSTGACLANGAGYMIVKDATSGRITVSAPDAENKTISVTR